MCSSDLKELRNEGTEIAINEGLDALRLWFSNLNKEDQNLIKQNNLNEELKKIAIDLNAQYDIEIISKTSQTVRDIEMQEIEIEPESVANNNENVFIEAEMKAEQNIKNQLNEVLC